MHFTFDPITISLVLTAFTAGLFGSLHCLGMCGGASAMIALGAATPRAAQHAILIPTVVRPSPSPHRNVLAFNIGRITSYMLAGALVGMLGGLATQLPMLNETSGSRALLYLLANVMIVATGLYLMGLPQLLLPLERVGAALWRHTGGLKARLLPMNTPTRAALFGLLWGWIPCGMVYAILVTAMTSGSALHGTLTMLAFGLGTLPMMLATGWALGSVGALRRYAQNARIRALAGVILIAMGLAGIWRADSLLRSSQLAACCIGLTAAPLRLPA